MGKVRLRDVAQPADNGATSAQGPELKPLHLSGFVVRKADLVEALRIYVPTIGDLHVTEDGEHFWLLLREGACDAS